MCATSSRQSSYHFSSKSASTYSWGANGIEIVDPLADADIADRQLQVVGDGHGDAAFGRAIELGEDDAVDAGDRHELARLREAVLADGRVEHEQDLVRRAFDLARGDPANLVELGHQVDARVQPPRGVDQENITVPRLARGNSIEHDRRRVGARSRADEVDAGARRPDLELLDRGSAKRIGRADERRPPPSLISRASLPTVVVFRCR